MADQRRPFKPSQLTGRLLSFSSPLSLHLFSLTILPCRSDSTHPTLSGPSCRRAQAANRNRAQAARSDGRRRPQEGQGRFRQRRLRRWEARTSISGCTFGEGCHFLHYFPGDHHAVAKMSKLGGPAYEHPPGRMRLGPAVPDGPLTLTLKTRLCNKYNTEDGCKWGDKCLFAHGEEELGKHMFVNKSRTPCLEPRPTSHFAPPAMLNPGMTTPASFDASATAKISVDASLAGAIIGRGGINTKYISRVTGAKLAIQDHGSDASLKNIELVGTFDQINDASAMVTEMIVSIGGNSSAPLPGKNLVGGSHRGGGPGSNFKTKLCAHFAKGSCTFGDRCHFAHGENELHNSAST